MQTALRWETESVNARKNVTRSLVVALALNDEYRDAEQPASFVSEYEDSLKRTSAGWECSELCIEMKSSEDKSENSQEGEVRFRSGPEQYPNTKAKAPCNWDGELNKKVTGRAAGNVTRVRLTSSLDTIIRYQSMLKRDLYRALEALRRHRRKTVSSD